MEWGSHRHGYCLIKINIMCGSDTFIIKSLATCNGNSQFDYVFII